MNGDRWLSAGFKREDDDRPTYDVYFNANGAVGGAPLPVRTISGNNITLPDQVSMEKPGYSFAGWTKNKSGTGTIYAPHSSYTVTESVTLYAKWLHIYTVTFNANGATSGSAPAAVTADSGTVITLPDRGTLVKTGYNFDGWNTNNDGTAYHTANSSYTVNGNVTLYAKWIASVPNTPTNVSATVASSSSITVSWSTVSGATGYYVYRSTSPSGTYSYATSTSSTSFTNSGLSSGTTYYYKVSAYNSGGESSQSSYVSATTILAAPNTPTNVSATAASSSSITVSWSAVSEATGYRVYRSTSASGTYTNLTSTASTSFTNTGLSSGTTYYYKVSAYNNGGESSQSSYVSATTNDTSTTGTFNDTRNNKRYKTVKIYDQTWMAENLNYQSSTGNSWCYGNNTDSCKKYGRLYDWETAKTVCPTGWHLPSRFEWGNLATSAGVGWDYGGTAGKKLKSTSGWNSNGNGSDDFGFSALPGGGRGSDGGFTDGGNDGYWWTASEYSSGSAYCRFMLYYSNSVGEYDYDKLNGFSVRCVKD
jgi:uncharacterized protein (TIGR02145 family)/uncharacterized repeat protein (TIGR02543 family)